MGIQLTFDVKFYGDKPAGLRAYSDTLRISCESGDFGGAAEEFEGFMLESLKHWYDGASVSLSETVTTKRYDDLKGSIDNVIRGLQEKLKVPSYVITEEWRAFTRAIDALRSAKDALPDVADETPRDKSSKTESNPSPFNKEIDGRRLGKFRISQELLRGEWTSLIPLTKDVVIVRAEATFHDDMIHCVGLSMHFDHVPYGESPPEYCATSHRAENGELSVTWSKTEAL